MLSATRASAGPPYATDDPQPADPGHWEVYLATQTVRERRAWSGTSPHVEVNYGLVPDVHLHAFMPFAFAAPDGGRGAFGPGDAELGLKFSPVHEGPWVPRIGTYPILTVPTGASARGLGNGTAQLLVPIWLLKTFGAWSAYGGAGVWLDLGRSDRRWLYVGGQVQRRVFEWLSVGTEVFLQTPQVSGGDDDVRFNIGAALDLGGPHHLLVSAGRGVIGPVQFQSYVAYQLTLGSSGEAPSEAAPPLSAAR